MGSESVSCTDSSSDILSLSRSRSLSSASSASVSARAVPGRDIEFLEFYPKRRFHPVHLNDTLQSNRYKVIRKLGFGSFSTVWLARDSRLERYVALKIGCAEDAPSGEMDIYRRLANTNYVSHAGRDHYLPLLDRFRFAGPNGRHEVLAYEPMGASVQELKDHFFSDGPLPLWITRSILWQTVLGLDFLLANGVVHGDVQPRNLLLTMEGINDRTVVDMSQDSDIPLTPLVDLVLEGGVEYPKYLVPADPLMSYLDVFRPFKIKITDLGGSFLISEPPTSPAPPIHLRGPETIFQKEVSAAQDMWSFGCLLFEFVTGIALFDLMDHPVTSITDDMHFIDMYNVLGFPKDRALRDAKWPNWRSFFTKNGVPMNHYPRRRERDLQVRDTSHTLESLLEEGTGGTMSEEELDMVKDLLRGLLEFDPAKRMTTQDVIAHPWFGDGHECCQNL